MIPRALSKVAATRSTTWTRSLVQNSNYRSFLLPFRHYSSSSTASTQYSPQVQSDLNNPLKNNTSASLAASTSTSTSTSSCKFEQILILIKNGKLNDAINSLKTGDELTPHEYLSLIELASSHASASENTNTNDSNNNNNSNGRRKSGVDAKSRFILDAYRLFKTAHPSHSITNSVFRSVFTAAESLKRDITMDNLLSDLRSQNAKLVYDDILMIVNGYANSGQRKKAFSFIHSLDNLHDGSSVIDAYLHLCDLHILGSSHVGTERKDTLNMLKQINKEFLEENLKDAPSVGKFQQIQRLEKLVSVYSCLNDMETALKYLQEAVSLTGRHPNASTYRALIRAGSIHQNNDLVLNCYEECKKYYGDKLYYLRNDLARVIFSYDALGKIDQIVPVAKELLNVDFPEGGESARSRFYMDVCSHVIPVLDKHDSCKDVAEEYKKLAQESTAKSSSQTSISAVLRAIREQNAEYFTLNLATILKEQKLTQRLRVDIARLLEDKKDANSLGLLVKNDTVAHGKPLFPIGSAYVTALFESKQSKQALAYYMKMIGEYNYEFSTQKYARLLNIVGDENPDIVDTLLEHAEKSVPSQSQNDQKFGFPFSSFYSRLATAYTRSRAFNKAINVFNRVISKDNNLNPVPSIVLYNSILMGLLKEWNIEDFEKMHGAMVKNGLKQVNRPKNAEEARARTLTHYETMDEGLAEKAYLCPPDFIQANRITHNIWMTHLLNTASEKEVVEYFKESCKGDDVEKMTHKQPNHVTYEILGAALMKMQGEEKWNDKGVQKRVGEMSLDIMKTSSPVCEANLEEVIETVDRMIKKVI